VVVLVRLLDSIPPRASTAPTIASLSPVGISAQEMITSEKNKFGSGVNGRIEACLFFKSDAVIQLGVMTGIIRSCEAVYWGKSLVDDIICVRSSKWMLPPGLIVFTSPAWSSRVFRIYSKVSKCV
jgi:hypothetical protein